MFTFVISAVRKVIARGEADAAANAVSAIPILARGKTSVRSLGSGWWATKECT